MFLKIPYPTVEYAGGLKTVATLNRRPRYDCPEHAWCRGRLVRALTLPFARPLLNVAYRFIARNRIRWFGTACRLVPDPERLLP